MKSYNGTFVCKFIHLYIFSTYRFTISLTAVLQENYLFENNNNYYDEDFASFATCQFSTLKRISSCLEDVVNHKKLDIKKYVCIKACFSNFSRDFSSSLPI